MLFNFLFNLFTIIDIVISGGVNFVTQDEKNRKLKRTTQKREYIIIDNLQGKDDTPISIIPRSTFPKPSIPINVKSKKSKKKHRRRNRLKKQSKKPLDETLSFKLSLNEDEKEKSHSKAIVSLSNNKSMLKTANPESIMRFLLNWKISNVKESELFSYDNGNTIDLIKESKALDFPIPKDIEHDSYLIEIFKSLNFMPTALVKIIGGYNHHDDDETIKEYSDRISDSLFEITDRKISFNLHDPNFMPNLLKTINSERKRIASSYRHFWNDLKRFLFKWALLMRKSYPMKDDDSFQKLVKGVIQAVIMIREETRPSMENHVLESMKDFEFFIFNDLVSYEILDYPELIKLFFGEITDSGTYLIMTIDQIEAIYCNGNFNTNPLLRLMLIHFATDTSARDQMFKRGWIIDKDAKPYEFHSDFATGLLHIYSGEKREEEERASRVSAIESLRPYSISQSTIKFFIDNDLKFRIKYPLYLVIFLRRLEYMGGLPEKSSIDMIIKFEDETDDQVYEWDINSFKMHLSTQLRKYRLSQQEYDRFIELVE